MELYELTITKAHEKLVKREISSFELTKAFLERTEDLNKKISSYLTVTFDSALSEAKKIDDLIRQRKKISMLAGIPLAIKDNILVEGVRCTAASKILEAYIAPYDATVVKRIKEQGAVILGKTNLDEFAMGSSTENSAFGTTKNPYDLMRVPGGSSGGSTAAVAANMCCYALGSDTGGSIRQPASFCGVVGLKPTYGAVSRYGLIAMASSLDQIGLATKTVEDAKIVFEAIAGKDPLDSTSVELPKLPARGEARQRRQTTNYSPQTLKIGVPKEYFIQGMDPEVERIIRDSIEKLESLKIKIEEISLPHTDYALASYYIIMPSEASANLARYDGIKYGHSITRDRKAEVKNLLDVYLRSREGGFGEEVRRRIMLGTYVLSAGYYEAYYLRAQKVRTLIKKDFEKAFQKVDLILTPVSPTPAFKIGEKITDPLTMYLSDVFTIAVNLAGLPAISIPVGKIGKLPVGLQIIGKPFSENTILEFGQFFEENQIFFEKN
ncbi:MAG TPA: Asp-tRNA(Asn)/Glu-tRNA(Gln) amidotransferase subunit GatA [Candidatus Nealsonbacteria bacterium]|uniref:Amidase domain-containing protein n=1 Tax=marine sediment metagenome TaxID=412755 RepID=A0A0F9VFV4_9ZZZZ|nr:Asp-tRNA(Asn)/Glu-tRNA(Gln) amidotransferase subunit GatA [Candidatus Nealsonbacteria bacterium]HEB46733.1 Asp-tRNA(Asn)/Glu-tRNA(Gln) amidotransferase subunit GatA [Candidatus Nealsonbacteria bacterium]